jgi:1-acyl-sn-glycerol-3-phosphate acyltransferase
MIKTIEIFARSTLFNLAFFAATLAMAICTLPATFMARDKAMAIARLWVRLVYRLEKTFLDLDYEIRGWENVPQGQAFLLAAKHQSAYETMKLHLLFDDPAVVLKRELLRIPIWGRFLKKIDPIAIDRSNRDTALRSLIDGTLHVRAQNRPIVIFPQGTRVATDASTDKKPYKGGIAKMYQSSGLPIVPMALNTGIFWPRAGWIKRPGRIVFEFLPPIMPGKTIPEVMALLASDLENASIALTAEAREKYPYLPPPGLYSHSK